MFRLRLFKISDISNDTKRNRKVKLNIIQIESKKINTLKVIVPNMDYIEQYFKNICTLFEKIVTEEKENIEKAADILSRAIIEDRLIHVVGTGGHSYIGAEEIFYRAGGLIPVNAIFEPSISLSFGALRSTALERTVGIMPKVLDLYNLKPKDPLIIVNAYGINAATIDTALEARKKGLTVIAITSVSFSKSVPADHPARHPSKKNLYELADVVVDSKMPFGDAMIKIDGLEQKVGPVSTILNAFVLNSIIIKTVEKLLEKGVTPPIWVSANIPGGDEANKKWIEKYKGIIRHL